ncbi:MAG: cytochrome c peroxidase [Novosphingobium sp.]
MLKPTGSTRRYRLSTILTCLAMVAIAVSSGVAAVAGTAPVPVASLAAFLRPAAIPSPADNPATADKIRLGKMLFFDPRLSGSGAISCASCHNPSLGWQDGLATGIGHHGTVLGRHTPTILNTAWAEPLFWDGRADTLEQQALGPMLAAGEMAGTSDKLVATLSAIPEYRDGFECIFPGQPISAEAVAKLIAVFERTVVSGTAPFDRWAKGDTKAVSDAAKRGFALFTTKANCASCHSGWRFTDDGFHDIGLPGDDPGRAKFMPDITVLEHAFKTPTLRNIAERGPYMHDGSLKTLEAVVDHYDHAFVQRRSLSTDVRQLKLSAQEKADLVVFMKTLTSTDDPVEYPALPR